MEPPPTSCARLTRMATKVEKEGGYPSPVSACLRRAARGRRGTHIHGSAGLKRAAARYPSAHANRVRAGERGSHPNQDAHYPSPQAGGRGGGGPPKLQRMHHAHAGGREGYTLTKQCATLVGSQGEEEVGDPPKPERAHPAYGMQERERVGNP